MNYGGSFKGEQRITISSILLLVIFVSAAALIVAAIIWRPWVKDDAVAIQVQPTATADAGTVVQAQVTDTPVPSIAVAP
ncbi:MAG: hypothetical protein ABI559_05225 [Chloroflexota bacterium]